MIPPGASPVFHEPGFEQVRAIAEAALYLELGHLPFETAWLDRLLLEQPALPVVSVVTTVDRDADPHVWVSPRFARVMARSTHAALATLLPQYREALDSNLAQSSYAYRAGLQQLDGQAVTPEEHIRAAQLAVTSSNFADLPRGAAALRSGNASMTKPSCNSAMLQRMHTAPAIVTTRTGTQLLIAARDAAVIVAATRNFRDGKHEETPRAAAVEARSNP